jgi:CRP-like cAMP-binding protein
MIETLLLSISEKVTTTELDVNLCMAYFEPISVPKNSILEKQGNAPEHLYFICSGFMRLFYLDENGEEVTTHLSGPNTFFTSFLSFVNQQKAKENIASITACQIIKITRPNLAELIEKSENFKKFSLIIFEQAIVASEKRANDLATLSAEQRYKKMLEHEPEILQNVPVQYIASFLGMKPESLSRIRRQIIT